MSEPERTYSIAVRVRRTDDHVDGSKVFAAAVELGRDEALPWRREDEVTVEVHPVQTPPPEYDKQV